MNLYGQTRNAVYLSTLSRSICHKQISHHVVLSLNSSDRLTTVHLTNLRDNSGDRLVHLENRTSGDHFATPNRSVLPTEQLSTCCGHSVTLTSILPQFQCPLGHTPPLHSCCCYPVNPCNNSGDRLSHRSTSCDIYANHTRNSKYFGPPGPLTSPLPAF